MKRSSVYAKYFQVLKDIEGGVYKYAIISEYRKHNIYYKIVPIMKQLGSGVLGSFMIHPRIYKGKIIWGVETPFGHVSHDTPTMIFKTMEDARKALPNFYAREISSSSDSKDLAHIWKQLSICKYKPREELMSKVFDISAKKVEYLEKGLRERKEDLMEFRCQFAKIRWIDEKESSDDE